MAKNKRKNKNRGKNKSQKVSLINQNSDQSKSNSSNKKSNNSVAKESSNPVVNYNTYETGKAYFEKLKNLEEAKKEFFEQNDGNPYSEKQVRSLIGANAQKIKAGRNTTAQELADFGMTFKFNPYKSAPYEERKANRLAFDGFLRSMPNRYSNFYKSKANKPVALSGVSVDDYNFDTNDTLKAYFKLEQMGAYKKDLAEDFIKKGINPSKISNLSVEDVNGCFVDVCNKKGQLKEDFFNPGQPWQGKDGGKIGTLFTGVKEEFLKDLATRYSVALEEAMLKAGYNPDNVKQDIENMKKTGTGPKGFNVHHRYPLAGSAGKDYPDVNAKTNFVLILDLPCHKMIHSYQDSYGGLKQYHFNPNQENKEIYPVLVMPKDGVVFYAGPNKELQVTTEQTNDRIKEKSIKNEKAGQLSPEQYKNIVNSKLGRG